MSIKNANALPPDDPWLTIVMPVHAGERWVVAALESVTKQDCRGIELIVIDSTDGDVCRKLIAPFAQRLALRYEHRPDILSWQAKTNRAVEQARSPYVAMLHQDDLWLPSRVAELRAAVDRYPLAVILLNPSLIVDEWGRALGTWRCPLVANRELFSSDIANRLLVQNFIAIPAPVISRQAWLASGGLDEDLWYTADWDLYLKLIRRGATVYRPSADTAFRIHGSSLTISGSRNLPEFERQLEIVLHRHSDLLAPAEQHRTTRRATTSIRVNSALAQAAEGNMKPLFRAVLAVAALGPREAAAYLRDSRIAERALPRVKARLAGNL